MEHQKNTLTSLRKNKRMSQEKLGLAVAKNMGVQWTLAAAQKHVSLWERHESIPNTKELSALACALGVTLTDLALCVRHTQNINTFDTLVDRSERSFVGVCCTTSPDEMNDVDIINALRKGIIEKKLCIAFFVSGDVFEGIAECGHPARAVNQHTNTVNVAVVQFYQQLTEGLPDEVKNFVKIYSPAQPLCVAFPPIASNHYLLAHRDRGTTQSSVYMQQDSKLILEKHPDNVKAWERYFGPIFFYWEDNKSLPCSAFLWKIAFPSLV